ncbi:MAG: transketolase [Candidatus Lokiarchaeota archaeon]|nr:transketolase [Candidatus Lokiarchaeota archaeon]
MQISSIEEKVLLTDILKLKKQILKMIWIAQSGHPGGSLSCVNLIYLLYKKVMKFDAKNPLMEDRDIFILSKGHAAPALYAVLSKIGLIEKKELYTLRSFGSRLQGHPKKNKDLGIEISTGSLGIGFSVSIGCALAAKLNNNNKKIFTLLGDGELNEGVVWEAAMAASHYKLDNLIAIVDRNGIQSDGSTEEVMSLEPLADKWKAFGWEVIEIDGSNINEIINGFKNACKIFRKPTVVISYLIKGSDVSFMEHTRRYHGKPPNKEEYESAVLEINKQIEIIQGD